VKTDSFFLSLSPSSQWIYIGYTRANGQEPVADDVTASGRSWQMSRWIWRE